VFTADDREKEELFVEHSKSSRGYSVEDRAFQTIEMMLMMTLVFRTKHSGRVGGSALTIFILRKTAARLAY